MISDSAPAGPIFGRAEEVDDFTRLLGDRAQSSITLVGGDAGIGKTRLLQEVAEACRQAGGHVFVGRCLDLGESAAPYLPVTDIVRAVRALPATAELASVAAIAPTEGLRPIEFFDAVTTIIDDLAQVAPALVVLEDVHWADRSTRELLTYLLTHGVPPGVHLVATYRTDDLHRRHPLRSSLAVWSRLPRVRRLLLEPLETDPASALVHHLRPDLPDDAARQIVRRSGGNPFFTEELVAASMPCSETDDQLLPADLADLLLVRTDALDDDTRQVLRAVSIVGTGTTEDTLQQLTGLSATGLHRALRAAVDAHVLVIDGGGRYDFRHALLAEAMYDDLLPGERVQLHDRLTDLLLARGGPGTAAALAVHAERASRFGEALRARVAAAQEALDRAAPANAARHFEGAMALAAAHAGLTGVPDDLPQRAAEALLAAGDPQRATKLMRDALRTFDGSPVERGRMIRLHLSAFLLTDPPTMHVSLSAPDLPDQADRVLDTAAGWAREADDDILVGQLLALKAHYLLAFGRLDEATVTAGEALLIGRAVDEPSIVSDAMTTQAKLDGLAGDLRTALATLDEVRARAAADGDIRAELRALHQLAGLQSRTDQHELAMATYEKAVRRAAEANARTELYGLDSVIFAAVLAAKLGDWQHADELLAGADGLPSVARASASAVRQTIAAARGDFDRVLAGHEEVHPLWHQDMFTVVTDAPATIEALAATGDLTAAVAIYDEATATVRKVWRLAVFDAQIRMAALLLTAIADAVAGKPREAAAWAPRVSGLAEDLTAVLALRGSRDALGSESHAWFARARAELARLDGDDSVAADEYRQAAADFELAGFPYEQATIELLLSRVLHSSGEHSQARAVADRALATARRLGAAHLVAQLRTRARADDAPAREGVLTPRERDVLELVAAGMTNGQLAAKLFISTKTASVHVSNILAKLGAATRTEAADLARQRGLLD
ncbi:helix-turn-helix transcriptional regulator [Flexivirga caeni]|nr:helix-turn-helix transcriptional regulator [Flexivirga caeni]